MVHFLPPRRRLQLFIVTSCHVAFVFFIPSTLENDR